MELERFELLKKVNSDNIWDSEPIFCFTSDIDWASEDVLKVFFDILPINKIKLTAFVTHESVEIEKKFSEKLIDRCIHPNFLQNSSHGNSFEEIVQTCIKFAPESYGFRSHRLFDVTDITHLLYEKHGYRYVSNLGTTLAKYIRPVLHESGLVHYPIFFEDGSHLYNQLDFDIKSYLEYFKHPGIKIINFHPMNMVFNTPYMKFMREIKDTLSREEYNNISFETIELKKNKGIGITNTVKDIIDFVFENNYKIMSLKEIYHKTIE
jgi:hypothetical protein